MSQELVKGISNMELLRLARIGIAVKLNDAIEEKESAEKRNDTWATIFYSEKSKKCSANLTLIENAIDKA